MPLITRFDTPASLRDLPAGSPFYDNWHAYLAGRIAPSTPGSAGGEFYDASEVNVNVLAERSLVWMAFPRELMVVNHRDDRRAAWIAGEDRDVQAEYCEWRVTRNAEGKITRVVFVTETPEYWEKLWDVSPARVVELYRALVDPAVVDTDLAFPRASPTDPLRYNRRNRWNHADGIVHLIQSINTLDAALGLSQGSVNSGGARDNFEVPMGFVTSVDPRVTLDIGTLARKGLSITLRDPIGLYIEGYDDTGWTKPDGSPVDDYWTVVRGSRPGRILRLQYEVPAAAGFVVGDIRIGGRPIEYGGQIAEHVTCTVGGVAGRRAR
jgi:hypothetical protein